MKRMLVAVVSAVVLLSTACGGADRVTASVDSTADTTATATSTTPATATPVSTTPATRDSGSGGIPHLVKTHCGVMSTTLAGVLWLADPPLQDDSHNPPAGWDNPEATGTFVELSDSEAEFRADTGVSAHFRRAPVGAKDPYPQECN